MGGAQLNRAIANRGKRGVYTDKAVVASTGPLTVTWRGGTVAAIHYPASYTPTVADNVDILVDGRRILVLGVPA